MKTDSTTRRQRQILLFAAGVVFLSEPVISIFRIDGTVAGMPGMYVALFSIWALLIGAAAWMTLRRVPTDPLRSPDPTRSPAADSEHPDPSASA
jgi:hypothetical protein